MASWTKTKIKTKIKIKAKKKQKEPSTQNTNEEENGFEEDNGYEEGSESEHDEENDKEENEKAKDETEKESRKKGLATEALILAMDYAIHIGKTNAFVAKINDINEPSKQLFEKLGFILTEDVNYFKQVTYELEIENDYQNKQYKQWKVLCDRNH